MVGTRIAQYEVLRKLGQGGMGEVYLGRDSLLDRRVAIKVLRPDLHAVPESRARFLSEARLAAALHHPHIAVLFEVTEAEGRPYLVMEYVAGQPLDELIRRGPIDAQRTAKWAVQLASALDHAHRRGIIHRDLKPANILIDSDGSLKLLDFGIARALANADETRLTVGGAIVGTPAYIAPEVYLGQAADQQSDIYALGLVLYEMLDGRSPFAHLRGTELLSAIVRGERKPATALPGSPRLCAAIERALAVDRHQRFSSAAELLEALTEGEPVLTGTSWQPARQSPAIVLEFENVSKDADSGWLGLGLCETIGADLQRMQLIRQLPREAAVQVKAAGAEALRQAAALEACWLIEGSYQKAGPRIRITPRVTEVATGRIIAAAKVDGQWEDLFDLQDRVVAELAAALTHAPNRAAAGNTATIAMPAAPAVAIAPAAMVSRKPDHSLSAYQLYAEGKQLFYQFDPASVRRAMELYRQALERDPGYAPAHSALGFAHAMRYVSSADPADLENAVVSLEEALRRDPNLNEPYPYLCYVYGRKSQIQRAIDAGLLAVERMPDYHFSHYFLATAYLFGVASAPEPYWQRAADCLDAAIYVQPMQESTWILRATVALAHSRYSTVEASARLIDEWRASGRKLIPFLSMHRERAIAFLRQGLFSEAREQLERGRMAAEASDHMYRQIMISQLGGLQGELAFREERLQEAFELFHAAWRWMEATPFNFGAPRIRVALRAGLAGVLSRLGDGDAAAGHLAAAEREMVELLPGSWVPELDDASLSYALAIAAAQCGDPDQGLHYARKAVETGWRDAAFLKSDPLLGDVRERRGFSDVLRILEGIAPLDLPETPLLPKSLRSGPVTS